MTASAQRAAEPSMEEILASIRRIIADDKSRTRIGPAKLVSVSEQPAEKPVAAAPAAEFHRPDTEPARAPVDEAQTFGEGREAFSVAAPPEGEGARLAELEAPPSLPDLLRHLRSTTPHPLTGRLRAIDTDLPTALL